MQKDMAALNVKPATVNPQATQEIQGMLTMIQTLIDKGHAYVADDGTVYFKVKSFKEYGKLSHKNLDELQSGFRELKVSGEEVKEDPNDFVLWKPKKKASLTGSLHGAKDVQAGILSVLLWQSIIWVIRSIFMQAVKT